MNEIIILLSFTPERPWGIDIPNYFWFTGSSAAAFIISSFAHVFGKEEYKPIAGFSLLLAFILLVAAPFNLVDDLKQPSRVINFFLYGWENFPTSPMKWGVLLLIAYPVLILFEALILYRTYFVEIYNKTESNLIKFICKTITFNNLEISNQATKKDYKLGFILGCVGIPLALCVHGYTGYILGVVHSISLWHTPLMPILFLASAMVSGTGLLIIILPIFQKFFTDFKKVDIDMIVRLMKLLAWFIVIDLIIRALWLSFAMTFNDGEKYQLMAFFKESLAEIILVEYVICLIIPMIVGFNKTLSKHLSISIISSVICAIGVWVFRYSTVVGGQSIPKTSSGFLKYTPHAFGQDSIVSVISNWGVFIALLFIIMAIFPWDKEMNKYYMKDK
ncbi:NrfD/PsrC family molybdoenzyme membrane anchor subunit [Campylobacter geochelonis]|uniref:NrfD/PsrC family molybdoenzyme membrane anchor subunit n=1 Tax=Campylobacter geochelonis TaxID=1780362 RepID=UPI00077087B9|nr:NrfD/PsrC family molybdoenzyme membrane anchor subunit [Campylobacter geochelonis]CZE50067.1 phosphatidylglycerophosphatase A [Campylobacter geochelonis]